MMNVELLCRKVINKLLLIITVIIIITIIITVSKTLAELKA